MFSIMNYIEAKRRLELSTETIQMMGGEIECNQMLLAQHEMIQLELDYHKTVFVNRILILGLVAIISFIVLYFEVL